MTNSKLLVAFVPVNGWRVQVIVTYQIDAIPSVDASQTPLQRFCSYLGRMNEVGQ